MAAGRGRPLRDDRTVPSDWERVAADAALLDRVRRAYTGEGDAADHLWWLDHPGEPGPSGSPDPAEQLHRARVELYRPDPPGTASKRVAALERRIETDRAAVRAALDVAVRQDAAPAPAAVPVPVPVPVASEPGPTGPPARAALAPAPHAAADLRRSPRYRVAGALVVALLAGGVLGALIARGTGAPSAAALSVFATRQQEEDRTGDRVLPRFVEPGSTRLLGTSTTTGLRAFAARTRDGDVCLLGVVLESRFLASCTSREGFAAGGLRLVLQAEVDPEDDSGVIRPRQIEPTWSPEGTFAF